MTTVSRIAALLALLAGTSAHAQINDDIHVRRAATGEVEPWWADRGAGWTYDVWRHDAPENLLDGTQIVAGTAATSHLDLAAPPGLIFYGLHSEEPPPPGCSDDAWEENDDPASAATLAAGWMDLQKCAGDDDWFAVPLASGGTVRAAITYDSRVAGLLLELRTATGTLVVTNPFALTFTAPSAGMYLLRVTGAADAEVPYRLLVENPFVPPPCDPDYASPNHSMAAAIPGWPEWIQWNDLALCDGTEDWFTHEVPPDYTLQVWVDPYFPISYDLSDVSWYIVTLYDTDGTTPILELDSRHGATGFDLPFTTGGTYYLRIQAHITTYDFWDHTYGMGATVYPN